VTVDVATGNVDQIVHPKAAGWNKSNQNESIFRIRLGLGFVLIGYRCYEPKLLIQSTRRWGVSQQSRSRIRDVDRLKHCLVDQ